MDGRQVDTFHVDGIDLVELVLAHLQHRAVAVGPARVVDHGVELAVTLHGGIHQRLHLGRAGHVGLHKLRRTPRRHDLVHHPLPAHGVDVVHRDAGSFAGQAFGDAFTNAVAGTRDDDGLVGYTHIFVSLWVLL